MHDAEYVDIRKFTQAVVVRIKQPNVGGLHKFVATDKYWVFKMAIVPNLKRCYLKHR
jgi:methylaspartate ammonia-lyase